LFHHFVLRCPEIIKDRVTRLRKRLSAFSALKNPPFSAFRHVSADAYDISLIFHAVSVTVFIRTRLIPVIRFSHVSFLPNVLCEEITIIYSVLSTEIFNQSISGRAPIVANRLNKKIIENNAELSEFVEVAQIKTEGIFPSADNVSENSGPL